jgi:hypothetical protein
MLPKESGIYCFENKVNGKKYVGQSKNIYNRMQHHKSEFKKGKNSYVLQKAWDKYGEENFLIYVIELCCIELLYEREVFWIKELQSHIDEFGYNVSWGGESGMRGRHHSKSAKKKMSIAKKGKPRSKESVRNSSIARTGIPQSDETKKKISKANMGNKNSLGTKRSDDSKQKISKANTGKVRTEEMNQKMSESKSYKKMKGSSSQYIGVCIDNRRKKWKAYFRYNRKIINLGSFKTEIEAAIAYNKKAIEMLGDKAILNIIPEKKEV